MVPPKFSTHEDCREAVCCCCGVKTDKKRISVREEALVVEFAKKEYDSKVQSYPAGLCLNCRRHLFQCAKNKKDKVDWDWIGRAHPKLLWDNFELSTERYDPCTHSDVTCTLCQVAEGSQQICLISINIHHNSRLSFKNICIRTLSPDRLSLH